MKFIILTIFCNLLSSGHLQETNNVDDYNLIQPDAGKSTRNDWPVQTFHPNQGNFYSQAQRSVLPKPCTRRSNSESEPISQLSPPLAKMVETLSKVAPSLKPQSLRSGDYDLKTTGHQQPLSEPLLTIDGNSLHKTRNFLTVSNPVIDSFEENHHEIIPTTNNEIQEDNPKPPDQMRSAPTSNSPAQTSELKYAASKRDQSQLFNEFRFVPDNEYGAEPENHYISEPSYAIASEHDELRSTQINEPSTDKSEQFPGFVPNFHSMQTQTLPPELLAKLISEAHETAALPNKCSHDKEPNDLIGHSRRSLSSYNDGDSSKDTLSNDKEFLRNNNDPYIESRIDNKNAMASVLNVEKNNPMTIKDQGLRTLDKFKSPTHEKSVSRVGKPQFNDARREMFEPTKGAGVVNMGQSALMLMQTERICYACSTANNPSCWTPDKRTTVKYCRKGNNACVTKTFGKGSTFTLIRDCGRSCDDSDTGGIMPKYNSCSMCHTELCNGAYSINGHNILFALILIPFVKYLS